MNYEQAKERMRKKAGLTERELADKIYLAQQWHNPLNYDDGSAIAREHGWSSLFTDELKKAGYGRRFYFRFKSLKKITDSTEVFIAFIDSPNWDKYLKVWVETAPEGLNYGWLYALAVTEMTVDGYANKEAVMESLEGNSLLGKADFQRATYKDSVDGYLDGEAIQIKSPATSRRMS